MFLKVGVLKNFAKFHRKLSVFESLFNKVEAHQACKFIKKKLQRRCFETSEISKNNFSYRTPLPVDSERFIPCITGPLGHP